jgi:hypothetical protein
VVPVRHQYLLACLLLHTLFPVLHSQGSPITHTQHPAVTPPPHPLTNTGGIYDTKYLARCLPGGAPGSSAGVLPDSSLGPLFKVFAASSITQQVRGRHARGGRGTKGGAVRRGLVHMAFTVRAVSKGVAVLSPAQGWLQSFCWRQQQRTAGEVRADERICCFAIALSPFLNDTRLLTCQLPLHTQPPGSVWSAPQSDAAPHATRTQPLSPALH